MRSPLSIARFAAQSSKQPVERSIGETQDADEPAARFYLPRYRSASTSNENAGEGWRRLA